MNSHTQQCDTADGFVLDTTLETLAPRTSQRWMHPPYRPMILLCGVCKAHSLKSSKPTNDNSRAPIDDQSENRSRSSSAPPLLPTSRSPPVPPPTQLFDEDFDIPTAPTTEAVVAADKRKVVVWHTPQWTRVQANGSSSACGVTVGLLRGALGSSWLFNARTHKAGALSRPRRLTGKLHRSVVDVDTNRNRQNLDGCVRNWHNSRDAPTATQHFFTTVQCRERCQWNL